MIFIFIGLYVMSFYCYLRFIQFTLFIMMLMWNWRHCILLHILSCIIPL